MNIILLKKTLPSWCFLLLFWIYATSLMAQSKIEPYLKLEGHARLDSLELYHTLTWSNKDSVKSFAEIQQIKDYALQQNDAVLAIFSDYLKGTYLLNGKQKNRKASIWLFSEGVRAIDKLPSTPLTQRMRANLEHWWGVGLFLIREYSAKEINHILAADLIYRKIGYQNILFADYKLANLGLYFFDRVSDYPTALRYLKEGERYAQQDPIDWHRIHLYRTLAKCLVELKQYREAVRYNELGIAQVHSQKDSVRIGALSGNTGEIILNHYPNPIEAEPYFQKELYYRLRFKPDGYDDIAKVYGNLCQIAGHKHDSQAVTDYYAKAITFLKKHINPIDIIYAERAIYKNRMIADTLIGDYKSAFKHEILYREAIAKLHKEDIEKAAADASVKFEAENNKLQAELANQQVQKSRFWVIITSLLLLFVLIGGYVIYFFQQIKRTKLAQQLEFEQKQAERLAELDSLKTKFFANISHEFRTPLTLILSPLKELQKEFPKREVFNMMQKNANRLLSLINQLLDLSKLEAGKMESQKHRGDLAQFLKYVFSSFESLAQHKNIFFQCEQSHQNYVTEFDQDKVEKIVTNLLSNAFKFTQENGRIKVRVDFADEQTVLQIQDYGIGIEASRLPHIFDRFYQVENDNSRRYEGTGIGLALVKELVGVLDGTIKVASELGKGTTFVVTLPSPLLQADTMPVSSFEQLVTERKIQVENVSAFLPTDAISNGDKKQVLIVEDNPDLRRYVRSLLESDYQIIEAMDGQEGIEKAIETIPDLIICDLMMPRLDGLGLSKILKTDLRTSHIPIVMLTAKASLEDRLEGLEHGADDYLAKPFNTDELLIRVRNLIHTREAIQQKFSYSSLENPVQEQPKPLSMDDVFLQKTNEAIDQNIAKSDFDLEAMAEQLTISTVQLRRKLRALTNQTPIEYMRNYRLEKAANLLKQKQKTVSEVAYLVGFDSLSYFSKSFQERFGKKPSEW
ncbi:MAG: response regulator [Spirosomataceae bacterium]